MIIVVIQHTFSLGLPLLKKEMTGIKILNDSSQYIATNNWNDLSQ